MTQTKISFQKLLMLLIVALTFFGCVKDDEDGATPDNYTSQVNKAISDLMKDWYLWNDKVPSVDVSKYQSPNEALNALTFKPTDKWSFIMDTVDFKKYFQEGKMVGYGMGMQLDASNDLRITFVYKNSPIAMHGVTRGYKILKVNGTDVVTLINNKTFNSALGEDKVGVQATFQIEDLNGAVKDITLSKKELDINTVLHKSVSTVNGKKVGYLVFETFIETAKAELDEAFNYFKSEGVSELILDLRYNGGGSLDVANYLAGLIGGNQTVGKKFVELTYNPNHQTKNQSFIMKYNSAGLALSKVYIITTKSSASASEAIISGLNPYLQVYTVGEDTHGKPVGMNVFTVGKYAVAPITFKVLNANGQGEYFDGIKANSYTADNIRYDFGDTRENSLKQALYHIQNGTFDNSIARKSTDLPTKRIELTGFRAEVGAF